MLKQMARSGGYNPAEDAARLSRLSVDELVQLFDDHAADDVKGMMEWADRLAGQPGAEGLRERLDEALRRIAARSRMREDRLRGWGLLPDEPQEAQAGHPKARRRRVRREPDRTTRRQARAPASMGRRAAVTAHDERRSVDGLPSPEPAARCKRQPSGVADGAGGQAEALVERVCQTAAASGRRIPASRRPYPWRGVLLHLLESSTFQPGSSRPSAPQPTPRSDRESAFRHKRVGELGVGVAVTCGR